MGQQGSIGSLPGFGGVSFGGSGGTQAGLTGAVRGGDGGLTAYNPTTMSKTTQAAPESTAPEFTAAGMDATTGMPSYISNWLQSGGTGTMPTSTGILPSSPVTQSTAGTQFKPVGAEKRAMPAKEAFVAPPPPKPVVKPAATPAANTNTGINPVNMNWVNDPKNLAVADVYNGSQGVSAPGVVQTPGSYNPIQAFIQPNGMMPQFYSDGKGGYYSDAAGKVPLPKNVVDYMKFNGIK